MKPNPGMAILALAYAMSINLAQAQVNRCHDSSGRVVYSDRPCESSQSGGQIERRKTRDEIHRERLQAQQAEERKQQRNFAEQQREAAQQSARPLQSQPPPVARHSGNDWAARKALENASTSASSITNNGGKWDAAAEAERRKEAQRRASQVPLTSFTHCDQAFCYGNNGKAYAKSGDDTLVSPEGKVCQRSGVMWACS